MSDGSAMIPDGWCFHYGNVGLGSPTVIPTVLTTSAGVFATTGTIAGAISTPSLSVFNDGRENVRKAARVSVECGGRTFVYDGTGALVATDGVYEEGRGTPDEEAADALERARAWAGLNQQGTIPYQNGLVDALQSSSLHGLSSSTAPNYGVANAAMNDAISGVVNALGQAEAK